MDIRQLTRNAQAVHACLTELPDGSLVTSKRLTIHAPVRWSERGLAYVGAENHILGVYAIIVDDRYYGVCSVNAMVTLDPSSINKIRISDVDYYEFVFEPGSTVQKSTDLVKTDSIPYQIYDEFMATGHVPWYIGYEEMGHIFDTALYHAGARVGVNQEVTQLIASILARDPNDRSKYYRTAVNSLDDVKRIKPVWVPLKSIEYSATDTLTKLGGSYFSVGVVSALNSPSERSERVIDILTQ